MVKRGSFQKPLRQRAQTASGNEGVIKVSYVKT